MADNQRLDDLRRRVQQDPSSIAFAQLAEEYRRAGQAQDAVDVCRAGLAIHPGYLSARVTLGRALLDLQHLDDAQPELEQVLKSAPENLAAIRGLADIHHRRGSLAEALVQYRAALALAKNDPDLEQTVNDLAQQLEPPSPPDEADGLSFEQATEELFLNIPAASFGAALADPISPDLPDIFDMPVPFDVRVGDGGAEQVQTRAMRTIAALEQWLHAIARINRINGTRAERHA